MWPRNPQTLLAPCNRGCTRTPGEGKNTRTTFRKTLSIEKWRSLRLCSKSSRARVLTPDLSKSSCMIRLLTTTRNSRGSGRSKRWSRMRDLKVPLSGQRSTRYPKRSWSIKPRWLCRRRRDKLIWLHKRPTELGRSFWGRTNIENLRTSTSHTDPLSTRGPIRSREASMRSFRTARGSSKWRSNTRETSLGRSKLMGLSSTLRRTKFSMIGSTKILIELAKILESFRRELQIGTSTTLRLDAPRCHKYSWSLGSWGSRLGRVNRIKLLKFGRLLEETRMQGVRYLLATVRTFCEPTRTSIIRRLWIQRGKDLELTLTVLEDNASKASFSNQLRSSTWQELTEIYTTTDKTGLLWTTKLLTCKGPLSETIHLLNTDLKSRGRQRN